MSYLSETVTIHTCRECNHDWTSAEIKVDGYGENLCPRCGSEVALTGERDALFWSVALYEADRHYGGPEEGGWYYEAGNLTEHSRIRAFTDLSEARSYLDKLWEEVDAQPRRGDTRLVARGWTERLPARYWPEARPRYC